MFYVQLPFTALSEMNAKYAFVGRLIDHTFCQMKLSNPVGQVFIFTSVLISGYVAVLFSIFLND